MPKSRRAVTVFMTVLLLTLLLGVVALSVDVGTIALVRTQLQAAADSSAMAAAAAMSRSPAEALSGARHEARDHDVAGRPVVLRDADVEFGTWDVSLRTFTPTSGVSNAVRVTCRSDAEHGSRAPLFLGRLLGLASLDQSAAAVAMVNPRDIALVVDLSGSMNDDTEPAWATAAINAQFAPQGYPSVGTQQMTALYADFGYGPYPGALEYVGQPLGVASDKYTYAEMTKDGGPLTAAGIASQYRIAATDSEATRKQKAYRWIIDNQVARVMPRALPAPNSASNYAYWAQYLDYILRSVTITAPGPRGSGGAGSAPPAAPSPPKIGARLPLMRTVGFPRSGQLPETILPLAKVNAAAGAPAVDRGTLPPSQSEDRITGFNNPNRLTFKNAEVPTSLRNLIGYQTYVQFMMDYGRDLAPASGEYVPLSLNSPACPLHSEVTAGGTFSFPPREQPLHAGRRSLIAALGVLKQCNGSVPVPGNRDWVSIITFDKLTDGNAVIQQPLTSDYDRAMHACTRLQAVGDQGASTATEAGLAVAYDHLKPVSEGGQGRDNANKVVVLLTDGVPNVYISSEATICNYRDANPSDNYYGGENYCCDASLMQAAQMSAKKWSVFPVGIGLGADYDFMDRMARLGGTADKNGHSPRGSGNPSEYERQLTDIFNTIIRNPQVRLVQ